MDHVQPSSLRERFKQAFKSFVRAHVVDDDPYDALENERFEAMIRAMEENDSAANSFRSPLRTGPAALGHYRFEARERVARFLCRSQGAASSVYVSSNAMRRLCTLRGS